MIKKIIITVLVLVALAGGFWFWFLNKCEDDWCFVFKWQKIRAVDSFERCAGLGFPVMESYPRQCRAGDKHFVEIVQAGLVLNSIKANDVVSSPLVISGYVDGSNRWSGFEGQVGTVQLLDGNGNLLTLGILTATDENWMQFPTNFSTALTFATPTTSVGTLVFKNENASGMPEYDREFRLPVKFASSSGTISLQAYFNNNNLDPKMSCEKVFPVTRYVPKTLAVAKAALEELLKGTTDAEMLAGYTTSLNSGVKINSLVIDKGVAKVDFNEALESGVAGSCRVGVIRLQIVETLKQFPSVSSVIISVNGRTEDILQP